MNCYTVRFPKKTWSTRNFFILGPDNLDFSPKTTYIVLFPVLNSYSQVKISQCLFVNMFLFVGSWGQLNRPPPQKCLNLEHQRFYKLRLRAGVGDNRLAYIALIRTIGNLQNARQHLYATLINLCRASSIALKTNQQMTTLPFSNCAIRWANYQQVIGAF